MPASVIEQSLARAQALLAAGSTAAGGRVYRARDDAYAADELPALNLRRGNASQSVLGGAGREGAERMVLEFDLEIHVDGAAPETQADALHMQAHALLMADAQLATLVRGLRCTGIAVPQTESADRPMARLVATYQAQTAVRPRDYTQPIA